MQAFGETERAESSGGTFAASGWRGFISTTSASGRTFEATAARSERRDSSQSSTDSRLSASVAPPTRSGVAMASVQPST